MAHRPSFRSVPDGFAVGTTQHEEIGVVFTLANTSDPRESGRRGALVDCPRFEHRANAAHWPLGIGLMILTADRSDRLVADCARSEMLDGGTYAYAPSGSGGKVDRAGGWPHATRRRNNWGVPSS